MDISPLSWTGYDFHIWPLRTILILAIGIEERNTEGGSFQESAISSKALRDAVIKEAVDSINNALYVGRVHMEHFLAQKGG